MKLLKIKYLKEIALVLLLLIPVYYTLVSAIDLEDSFPKQVGYLVFVGLGLLIPALFLPKKCFFAVEGILQIFLAPIEIASLQLNHQPTSKLFLNSIFCTNLAEATELLNSLWFFGVLVFIYWILYFWLVAQLDNQYMFNGKYRFYTLICTIGALLVLYGSMVFLASRMKYSGENKKGILGTAWYMTTTKFKKIFPYNIYIHSYDLWKDRREMRNEMQRLESFQFGISSYNEADKNLIVLVIGESARYDHFSINGYERPTSPYLEKEQGLITYHNMYSQANLTSSSIPFLLTRATALSPNIMHTEKSLPEAFQEAGYITSYISKNPVNTFTRRVMHSCTFFSECAKDGDVDGNYDMDILTYCQNYYNDSSAQMFVLHTLGSHFKYSLRYPKEFDYFRPSIATSASYIVVDKSHKQELMNSYDNTILYTDYFLHNLIKWADSLNRSVAIVYISDHGESFWDDSLQYAMHGSYTPCEAEYHIPFFIWLSAEYREQYPEKYIQLTQHAHTPVCSDVVFHTLLDLANIGNNIINNTRNICSEYLQPRDTIYVNTGTGEIVPYIIGNLSSNQP